MEIKSIAQKFQALANAAKNPEKGPANRRERRAAKWGLVKGAVAVIDAMQHIQGPTDGEERLTTWEPTAKEIEYPDTPKIKKQRKWWEMEIPKFVYSGCYINPANEIIADVVRVQAYTKSEARSLFKKQFGELPHGIEIRQVHHLTSAMHALERGI